MKARFLIPFCVSFFFLEAIQVPVTPSVSSLKEPWFTGPLLAPAALTIPPGEVNIEPYLYTFANIGNYDTHWHRQKVPTFWMNLFQAFLEFGINSWLDFQIYPSLIYNYTRGAGKWVVGDIPLGFDFQLYHKTADLLHLDHALLLQIREIIPIGKYQNLNLKKRKTDIGGGGSWQTQVGLIWGALMHLKGQHFLSFRTGVRYTLPAPTHVKNLNLYGGGAGTNGKVYPEQMIQFDTAIEINLTQNWAFAMDVYSDWLSKTRFKGKTAVLNTTPWSMQFSLAPALEYNWNSTIGIIFGSWFTIAGRNTPQFVSGIIAFNYYS